MFANYLVLNNTHFRFSHQCDGIVERHTSTVLDRLAIFAQDHQSEWDAYIPLVTIAYRTAVHDAANFTPAYLLFGHELRTPVDLAFGIRPPAPGDETIRLSDYLNQLKQRLDVAHNFARNNIPEKKACHEAPV